MHVASTLFAASLSTARAGRDRVGLVAVHLSALLMGHVTFMMPTRLTLARRLIRCWCRGDWGQSLLLRFGFLLRVNVEDRIHHLLRWFRLLCRVVNALDAGNRWQLLLQTVFCYVLQDD